MLRPNSRGFSLIEMLTGLGLISFVLFAGASMVSWSSSQIKLLEFKKEFDQSLNEVRATLANRNLCTMSLTLPNPMVINPDPLVNPEGVVLTKLELFDNNKVSVRDLAVVSNISDIRREGFNISRMRLFPRGKVGTDEYMVDLVFSGAVGKTTNKFSLADSTLPLLVKLNAANEVVECVAIRREGEVTPKAICASQNMTYDEITKKCVVLGEIRVEGRGFTLSCPSGFKMEWGEDSCSAEPSGYPLAEAPFRLRGGGTQVMTIPGQRPYKVDYLPTNSPDKVTCNFAYPTGVTNGADWYIWTYCIPR